jgi:hypothetical protein
MTRQLLLGAVVFLAAGSGAFSDDKAPSLPRPNTNANFDKLKKKAACQPRPVALAGLDSRAASGEKSLTGHM